ncbi:MAG: deoxynucleoside kinase [Acidithiobacillus sp.]
MTTAGLIVVEGPMGAGKTSLARLLSTAMDIPALLERPADNPFLGDFYRHQQHVLATELQFLLQRRQIFDHLEGGRLYIADHGPEKGSDLHAADPGSRDLAAISGDSRRIIV